METKSATIPQIVKWIWVQSRGSRGRVACASLLGAVRVCLSLTFVWVSKLIVDAATAVPPAEGRRIFTLAVILISLMLTEMVLSLAVNYISNQTEVAMRNRMRRRIYNHLLDSRWDGERRLHSGDLLNRLTEDVRVVVDVVCRRFQDTLVMLLQLIGALVLLFYMSPALGACLLCIFPVFLLLSKIYVRKTRAFTSGIRQSDSRVHTCMQEGLQHHVVVQTLECEPQMRHRLDTLQQTLYDRTRQRTRFSTFSRGMVRTGFIAGYLTAFLWSVWHLHTGMITFGTMTAFLQLVARIQNPMSNLVNAVPQFVQAMTSVDRLLEIESMPSEPRRSPVWLDRPVGVELRDVTFSYPGTDLRVFDRFSHNFAPGSKTVVMGCTGAGKSTLIKLILALQYPQGGDVKIYDSTRAVSVCADTRCNMVYVPQGNSLLEGTVRDNLLLGNPEADDEMLREALHTAVADFVYDLPQGLDTQCGELGSSLSEGQAQRIAIARALLREGAVLLLDEFNSALDRDTAALLIDRLTRARASSTIIFISHRPEVAEYCDNILNIDKI